jgi:hypothetical protein
MIIYATCSLIQLELQFHRITGWAMSPVASFLVDKFTVLGFEFQNWMAVVAVGMLLYGLGYWLATRNRTSA